ncbi:MAG: hypothetical protein ABIH67_04080 [Candidatus Uhrbacteria bacterium]
MVESNIEQFDLFNPPKPEVKPATPRQRFEQALDNFREEVADIDVDYPGTAKKLAKEFLQALDRQYTAQYQVLLKAVDKVRDQSDLGAVISCAEKILPQIDKIEELRAKGIFKGK